MYNIFYLYFIVKVIFTSYSTNLFPLELSTSKLMGLEGLEELKNSENFEIFAIDNLSNNDWWKLIVDILENSIGTKNLKFKYKALSYVIIESELFRKTPKEILLKCFSESKVHLEIFDVHSGSCGAHQEGHRIKHILF